MLSYLDLKFIVRSFGSIAHTNAWPQKGVFIVLCLSFLIYNGSHSSFQNWWSNKDIQLVFIKGQFNVKYYWHSDIYF